MTSKMAPEIEGVRFHVSGKEFISLLEKRVESHLAKAVDAESGMKTAHDAMETAFAAAKKAGKPSNNGGARLEFAATRSAMAGGGRNYGGSVESPVAALREAVKYHKTRATALAFYAKHLLPNATYVLSQQDINTYELLDEVVVPGCDEDFEE